MHKQFSLLLLILFSIINSNEILTRSNGEKIVIKENGTWIKFQQKKNIIKEDKNEINCEDLLSVQTDKMTGEKNISSTDNIIVSKDNKTGYSISLMKIKEGIVWANTVIGASSCIDEKSKIQILFHDSTRLELECDNDYNCDNEATIYFGGIFGKENELDLLCSKQIIAMRIWTTKSYVEEDIEIGISSKIKCILKYLKEKSI